MLKWWKAKKKEERKLNEWRYIEYLEDKLTKARRRVDELYNYSKELEDSGYKLGDKKSLIELLDKEIRHCTEQAATPTKYYPKEFWEGMLHAYEFMRSHIKFREASLEEEKTENATNQTK